MNRTRCFRIVRIALVAAGTVALPKVALAAPVAITKLYPTGVNDTGALLADQTLDGHWTVASSTDPANPGPNLYAFPATLSPISTGSWVANTATGRWLTLNPTDPNTASNAVFTFKVVIDLNGYQPGTASVTLRMAADDDYKISLNGTTTGITRNNAYGSFANHTIATGWQAGMNTLTFSVNNSGGGPTGFFVTTI